MYLLLVSGCATVAGLSDLDVATSDTTAAAGADASRDAGPSDTSEMDASFNDAGAKDAATEGDAAGPSPLIEIKRPDGSIYFIEANEVSQAQYQSFLLAKAGDTTGQKGECTKNSSFLPGKSWDPKNTPKRPVAGVDVCDARAYCAWVGRHLCGGPTGAPLGTAADGVSPAKSQWEYACTNGGVQAYPYGTSNNDTACVVLKGIGGSAEDVGARATCVGGAAGLYDMVGNASEWIDACDPDGGSCAIVGGSWHSGVSPVRCDLYFLGLPTTYADDLGFRCCKD